MTRPTDPLYPNQWHLAQIGDIERVWDYYTGRGVRVVVFDEGIDTAHEDLNGNYVSGGGFVYGSTIFTSGYLSAADGHGTAVAGLIAAEAGNGQGGVGVAWGAKVASLNFLEQVQLHSFSAILSAFEHAANFDVLNNSWGYTPLYGWIQSLAHPSSEASAVERSLANIAANGRGGLGTVIVNAAGNDALNANGDGVTASRFTIAVGAVDRYGNVASYSNWGANILVAAPDAAYTTDITSQGGYNSAGSADGDPLADTNYTSVFGGTSASAPLVSGVVALMLEANPALGWRDVQNILAFSARHTGSALGAPPSGQEYFGWTVANTGTWNGGGTQFSPDYGFGLVNALAAVGMAEVWTHMHGSAQTSANEQHTRATFIGSVFIPDTGSARAAVIMAENIVVETAMVTVSLTHSYAPDLRLTLIAPDGTRFVLMDDYDNSPDMSTGFTWTFAVEGARGMGSAGVWELMAEDKYAGDAGTITGFTVDIYGAASAGYEVHTFTDDFLLFRALDPSRATLVASSANDWLNFAGVTGDVSVTLVRGGTVVVDANGWVTLGGTIAFTRLATGSGNDTVITVPGGSVRVDLGLGNDLLIADDTAGNFTGGQGIDFISYRDSSSGVQVDLMTNATSGGYAANDTIAEFENIDGSQIGDDRLNGTNGSNVISGWGGNDIVFDRGGNDTVDLEDGNDAIFSGGGRDRYIGGAGIDTLSYYYATSGVTVDILSNTTSGTWAGDDTISGFERIYGSSVGSDVLRGTDGDNIIRGYGGNDIVFARNGNDMVDLGDGNDTVVVGLGSDTLVGGNGIDNLNYYYSSSGVRIDLLLNTASAGYAAGDAISGFERVYGSNTGNDTLRGSNDDNFIRGYGGSDIVFDRGGNDIVQLGDGNDTVISGGGVDSYDGGAGGADEVSYFYAPAGIGIDLRFNSAYAGWAAGDTITGIERVSGSDTGNDTIVGSAAVNVLRGNGGGDLLNGFGGNDLIDGGTGNDTLVGGTGADSFVFRQGHQTDRIADFSLADSDLLLLDDALWAGMLTAAEVIQTFATVIGGNAILDFGGGDLLTLSGLATTQGLDAQITII